jgi:amino acid transporter
MAVGGMVGGGIFSTLGVVVAIAGQWTWLSFAIGGLVALAAGYSYTKLAAYYGEGGGAFTFLHEINADGLAGSLSWVLLVGYVLTNAVYAFTFGQYLGNVFDLGPWVARFAAVAVMSLFIVVNLRGVGEAGGVEVFLVWIKLVILLGLAAFGLAQWNPAMLSQGTVEVSWTSAVIGAASVFMAYEGFQLLTYDYDDIESPDRTLPLAVLSSIVVVIGVYIVVALGTVMLIGAEQVIEHEEVALAVAGQKALGMAGLIIVTIGAAFSTGSAINSTLFATARLAQTVARNGELPESLAHCNNAGIPDRAVLILGGMAALLAATSSLGTLVEAASLSFLFTFAAVCGFAFRQGAGLRIVTGIGAIAAMAATVALVVRLLHLNTLPLYFLGVVVLVATLGRPWILKLSR